MSAGERHLYAVPRLVGRSARVVPDDAGLRERLGGGGRIVDGSRLLERRAARRVGRSGGSGRVA